MLRQDRTAQHPDVSRSALIGTNTRAQRERLKAWLGGLQHDARLVVFEVGAGAGVPTVRGHGGAITSRFNGTLIRVNPCDADVPSGGIAVAEGAMSSLERLAATRSP